MSPRREFRELASPETLRHELAALDIEGGIEEVSLENARNRVLATSIDADVDVPGFDRAAMDGYAVVAEDTFPAGETNPVSLGIAGSVHAGEHPNTDVESGAAIEISTGAVIPPGATAVVKVEDTEGTDGMVNVRRAVAPGDNIMTAGEDIAAGDWALGAGTLLTAREIGLLSALGIDTVSVKRGPTVGIISTGQELVDPGGTLDHRRGEIYDVNSHTIAAAVEDAGGIPTVYEPVGDDIDAMKERLLTAADECDLVVTSGSTSASAMDLVYRVLEAEGALHLHGVAVKPGKPTIVGEIQGSPFVGLPGYPVSALSIFRAFLAPVIQQVAGQPSPASSDVSAVMATEARFEEGRRRLLPVGIVENGSGQRLAYPVDKGSGATTTLVDADGIVSVPATTAYLAAEEAVTVSLFADAVRPPDLLVVGEAEPTVIEVLQSIRRPRYLQRGSRFGVRYCEEPIADVGVIVGPVELPTTVTVSHRYQLPWGLIVEAGNPTGIDSLTTLIEEEVTFVNRTNQSGLRASLDSALESLAEKRGCDVSTLTQQIAGYGVETRGLESPARRVLDGQADVGLGFVSTAKKLGLDVIPLGDVSVQIVVPDDRLQKPSVQTFRSELGNHLEGNGDL